jgi:DNA-binding response OmpR family regulator
MHLLVIEDDPRLVRLLRRLLEEDRHIVETATTGQGGIEIAEAAPGIEVIILDLGLPDISGLEVARRVRAGGSEVAILMLTARDTVGDRVTGLDAGADDYLVKPFALVELLARVRALTRRQGATGVKGILQAGTLELDRLKRSVRRSDRTIPLAPRQFRLLEYLMLHAGRAVSRSELLREVWNLNFDPESNLVDAHISTLRSALERSGEPRLIHTVRGVGYTLKADPS